MGSKEIEKISKILNLKSVDVQNMESRLAMGDQSLNKTVTEDNNSVDLLSLLKDDSPTPDMLIEKNNDDKLRKEWLYKSINLLKEREKIIISNRKLEERSKTFEELGKKLNISKERVRQIEVEALKKLKNSILALSKEPKSFFIN